MDSTDKKILKLIQVKAKQNTKEIANQVGLSVTPTYERIKKLEAQGVIKSYVALLDRNKIGKQIIAKEKIVFKNVLAGIILGVPNYFSIIFLIKALQNKNIESSTLFTVNNVGVVVVSTFVGLWLFKEQFSAKNKVGIALALLGIVLVAFG